MPIYEYQCKECAHHLDALQKIGDEPLLTCPSCGRQSLKRLVSAPRFRLKGKGWYETDFKTGGQRNLAGDDNKGAPADKKKAASEKSGDSKPAKEKSDAGAAKSAASKSSG
ncbi:MAG: zinc ribbon domain-containing protein [Gammaproteobacteria bacterium]|nr:zinc ribbon domain-containing protein [Gammaproteobacteria bacterium]